MNVLAGSGQAMESGQLYWDPCTCAESASSPPPGEECTQNSLLPSYTFCSLSGWNGSAFVSFWSSQTQFLQRPLKLEYLLSDDRPTPDHRPGEETEAATIKFNRATSPRHPVPSRRKLYIGLMGPSGNASNAAAAVMHSSLIN